jgi:hypothetical protein
MDQRLTWLRGISLLVGVVAPTQPVFTTYGISDEPDPTSSRHRGRRAGFGKSGGGLPPSEEAQESGRSTPSGSSALSFLGE